MEWEEEHRLLRRRLLRAKDPMRVVRARRNPKLACETLIIELGYLLQTTRRVDRRLWDLLIRAARYGASFWGARCGPPPYHYSGAGPPLVDPDAFQCAMSAYQGRRTRARSYARFLRRLHRANTASEQRAVVRALTRYSGLDDAMRGP